MKKTVDSKFDLLKPVLSVPVLPAARTRPKFIGGSRAVYDEGLL